MAHVHHFTFNPFAENTYIVHDKTGEAVIVDPGCYESWEKEKVEKYIHDNNLQVKFILLTHGHIDHVLGLAWATERYKVKAYIHPLDLPTLKSVSAYASNYGIHQYEPAIPTGQLSDGQTIGFGNTVFKVLFAPGHAPGHVAFLDEQNRYVLGGDVLFKNSVGRWDLPGGDQNTLINSIKTRLYPLIDSLGNDVKVYPGHNGSTTLLAEKLHNPYTR